MWAVAVLAPARVPFPRTFVDTCGTYPAVVKVYGAGEVKHLSGPIRVHVERANNPIRTPRIVVDSSPQEVDIVGSEPLPGLISDGVSAHIDCLVTIEAVAVLAIVLAVAPVRAVSRITPVLIA